MFLYQVVPKLSPRYPFTPSRDSIILPVFGSHVRTKPRTTNAGWTGGSPEPGQSGRSTASVDRPIRWTSHLSWASSWASSFTNQTVSWEGCGGITSGGTTDSSFLIPCAPPVTPAAPAVLVAPKLRMFRIFRWYRIFPAFRWWHQSFRQ